MGVDRVVTAHNDTRNRVETQSIYLYNKPQDDREAPEK
jgi:hypothetical protein